jgi:hypothetical protein
MITARRPLVAVDVAIAGRAVQKAPEIVLPGQFSTFIGPVDPVAYPRMLQVFLQTLALPLQNRRNHPGGTLDTPECSDAV